MHCTLPTNVLQMSYKCPTNVLQMSHTCDASVLQGVFEFHTASVIQQVSYKCPTNVLQMSYNYPIRIRQMSLFILLVVCRCPA